MLSGFELYPRWVPLGFELYSRWVPLFPFLFLTHSLFFSDIPGSQPLFHSDFFIQHARKSAIHRPFRFLGYSFMLRLRQIDISFM